MKKIISLVLAVLLVFAGISVLAEESVTGAWYITGLTSSGVTFDPAVVGFNMSLVLNEDGSSSVAFNGQSATGTWTMKDNTVTVTAKGDPLELTYDGSTLSCDMGEDVFVVFSRETAGAEAFTEIYAEDISAFDGTWVPTQFGISGIYVTADALSGYGLDRTAFESLSFVISNGVVTADGEDVVFQLVDGLLFCEIEGVEGSFRIQLLEGDMLMIDMPTLPATLICSRAASESAAAGAAA